MADYVNGREKGLACNFCCQHLQVLFQGPQWFLWQQRVPFITHTARETIDCKTHRRKRFLGEQGSGLVAPGNEGEKINVSNINIVVPCIY